MFSSATRIQPTTRSYFLPTLTFVMTLASLICSQQAYSITSTQVLPKGVRAMVYVYGFSRSRNIDRQFNEDGMLEAFSKPLNRSFNVEDLADFEPELKDLLQLNGLGPMDGVNFGSDMLSMNLFSDINVKQRQNVWGLLWGLTDKITVGVLVPFIKRDYNFSLDAKTKLNVAALKKRLGNLPVLHEALTRLANEDLSRDRIVQKVFFDNGYNEPKSFSVASLGNIELEGRYKYFETKNKRMSAGMRLNLQLPTVQHSPDIRNIVDQELVPKTLRVKLGLLQDFKLIPRILTFNSALFGSARLPYKRTMAFPRDPSANTPDLTDPYQVEEVQVQHGPQVDLDLGLTLDFWDGAVSFQGSYIYLQAGRKHISGARDLDYAFWNSRGSAKEHAIELTAELSTIPLFLKDLFPAPGRIWLNYYIPFKGTNSTYTPYGSFNVALLF